MITGNTAELSVLMDWLLYACLFFWLFYLFGRLRGRPNPSRPDSPFADGFDPAKAPLVIKMETLEANGKTTLVVWNYMTKEFICQGKDVDEVRLKLIEKFKDRMLCLVCFAKEREK